MPRPEYRFAELLTTALEYLSMACVTLMALLVIAQVILRYVFNDPLTWSEEMARFTFIFLAFLGIGAAYGRRRHMFIDALVIELPPRLKRIVEFTVAGIATAFLVAVIGITTRTIVELYRMDITTPALELPMAYIYLVIPLGLSALIAQIWIDLFKERRSS
jgi:TRAP-type C4-dicarboxylate transport system permease small subunit